MDLYKNITDIYQTRLQETENILKDIKRKIYYISMVRVLLFIIGLSGIIYFFSSGWTHLIVCIAIIIIPFLILIKYHNKLFWIKDYLTKKIEINQQELEALNYNFQNFDEGEEYIKPDHLYTYDLDVFGKNSLFQVINRTATTVGKDLLAQWLNRQSEEKKDIDERQQAIQDLSADIEFRQQFRIIGLLCKSKQLSYNELQKWAEQPIFFKSGFIQKLPIITLLINLLLILGTIIGKIPLTVSSGVFVLFVLLSFSFTKKINLIQSSYNKQMQTLSTYSRLIQLIEERKTDAIKLQEIKQKLFQKGQSVSNAVQELSKYMNALDQRSNLLMSTILNGLFLWELRQTIRIEQWRSKHAPAFKRWIEAIAETDAYCSLATFAYNHPDYKYPVISNDSFIFTAEALGHPLMKRNKCVRNSIQMTQKGEFIIVTGANMAGKSTYLRTVGINFLLACMGLPVWAERMTIYPAKLITSLRTTDSLNDNESYFFAELKRLQMIINRLQHGEKLFIILDEILKGTNSIDKQKGSFALIEQFLSLQTNGIIATHDLLLGELAQTYPQYVRNFCFEADIKNNELTFSYRIREGIAQNMNACFLMKKMGIAVID